jgi:hypothetical protein
MKPVYLSSRLWRHIKGRELGTDQWHETALHDACIHHQHNSQTGRLRLSLSAAIKTNDTIRFTAIRRVLGQEGYTSVLVR